MTRQTKILLGVLAGAGVAWWLIRKAGIVHEFLVRGTPGFKASGKA